MPNFHLSHADVSHVNSSKVVPYSKDAELVKVSKTELSPTDGISDKLDAQKWWKHNVVAPFGPMQIQK